MEKAEVSASELIYLAYIFRENISSPSRNIFEKCFLKDVHHNLWENILHFTRKTLNATIFPRYLTKKPLWGNT
ncbi:MAG: hypothetical protein ACLU9T_12680 [Blautia faecis]